MSDAAFLTATLEAALCRVRGDAAVADWLTRYPDVHYDHLVAFGKAAAAMTAGAVRARGAPVAGLLITKHGHLEDALGNAPWLTTLESDHPVPGPGSLDAGAALLAFLEAAPPTARFLVLISGGASSLVEALVDGIDLDGLAELNRRLLAEGHPIDVMNAVRRSISRLKGGRLAGPLAARPTCALVISDVPGDDPAVIGSGPLTPSPDAFDAAQLGPGICALLDGVTPLPVPTPAAFANIDLHIIATLRDAKAAAAAYGAAQHVAVHEHEEFLDGDAATTGARLATWLCSDAAAPGLHIWGGETTVHLPASPGRGGRNQHLALAAAQALDGSDNVSFLACGTDGTDGATPDAGGIVDGTTVSRGREQQRDAQATLVAADSGSYLEATHALVTTGPTGTNVMDLVLALKVAPG